VVFTGLFAIFALTARPLYRAQTVLADARADSNASNSLNAALGQLGGLASIARIGVPTGTQVDEAMAVMKSRDFTEGFIQDHDLLPALFPDLWDAAASRWRTETGKPPKLAQAFKVFDAARSVTQATRGGLVTVTIEWRDPKQAADWANLLVQRLNSEMRARAIASTDKSVSYLEKELGATSTLGTQQAINRLIETQVNQRMLANVTQEYTFRVVDKALPPEPDDKIGPSKILLIALGFGIGLVFGMFAILVFNMLTANRAAAAKS
jgi:uncharacterized protein involved in exopolysaccharide biosynthesis